MAENEKVVAPIGDNTDPLNPEQKPASVDGGQGDLPEREWMKDLPEPLKGEKTLRKFSDENWKESIAKSYIELQRHLGDSVKIPAENAPKEEWEKFFSRIGRPAKAEEYDSSDGKLSKDFEAKLREKLFESGAPKKVYAGAIKAVLEYNEAVKSASAKAFADKAAEFDAKILKEQGDKSKDFLDRANTAISALFPESAEGMIRRVGLDKDYDFMTAMAAAGEEFKETKFVRGVPDRKTADKKDPYEWMLERYGHH